MKCDYCGSNTHERPICPWAKLDAVRPEYNKWSAECERERDAARYGHEYTTSGNRARADSTEER